MCADLHANGCKTADGFQLWSQTYDREINDIFRVQDEIALAATGALQVKLLGGAGRGEASTLRSANPDAYQAYLQGKYFAARGQDREDLNKALSYIEQAIQLDPNYAAAWAQRSQVLETMAGYSFIERAADFVARERARRKRFRSIRIWPLATCGWRRSR